MNKTVVFFMILFFPIYDTFSEHETKAGKPEWSVNATAIEACSCPLFCPCYFNTKPALQHDAEGVIEHYCRTNMAYRVNRGNYGATRLDGIKFWISAGVGGDFSEGQMEWAVLTFDKNTTGEHREAIRTILSHLFPVKWKSFTTAVGTIDKWEYNNDRAVATLDGGKTAEVRLKRFPGMTSEPVFIKNLKYWASPRNNGFVLMPNEVEAYRVGPNAFEFRGTSGFVITIDMKSRDFI